MKKIIYILLSACFLFTTACEEYLDVNKNIDAPDYVEDYLYLAGVTSTYQDISLDLLAIAPLAQMWSTTNASYSNTTTGSYAEHYNPLRVDAGAVIWRTVYFNHGMNLDNMMKQAIAKERWTLAGMALAMKAHGWDMLTKIYGEAPMKQFLDPNLTSFDYDYQDEIYEQVREWALEAIRYLDMDDKTNYGSTLSSNDLIYAGDPNKWRKFAYGVLVRNLSSLSNKTDFVSKYADKLIEYAGKSLQTSADDALLKVQGGSQSAAFSEYNNVLGTARVNLGVTTVQSDYAVQLMTGTTPLWEPSGRRVRVPALPEDATDEEKARAAYYAYELAPTQYICDTIISKPGHFDPRVVAKLSTVDNPTYLNIGDPDMVKSYRYYGGANPSSRTSPQGIGVPHMYNRSEAVYNGTTNPPNDGKGRYIFHDEAPYILMTAAEIKFCLAEAYWKKGDKANAYNAFKEGIKADLDLTRGQIRPGTSGQQTGGDKINAAVFQTLANEYLAGPYVDGLGVNNLTLSHIMMQKWCALWSWGGIEAWVDLRKYHYDIAYSGDYPSMGNGWDAARYIDHKAENDPNRIYKGFYLRPARLTEHRNTPYNTLNLGSPMYRIRPRYNSEYMWNLSKLEVIKPIAGTADNYHCSMPWFTYPNGYPAN